MWDWSKYPIVSSDGKTDIAWAKREKAKEEAARKLELRKALRAKIAEKR